MAKVVQDTLEQCDAAATAAAAAARAAAKRRESAGMPQTARYSNGIKAGLILPIQSAVKR